MVFKAMSKNYNNTITDSDIYTDPEESSMKMVLKELEGIGCNKELLDLISRTFPTWLIHIAPKYSEDYPHLDKNWTFICERNGATKKNIAIVDCILKDDHHLLINIFCERMTREGYIVRRKVEFGWCDVCRAGIPSENIYRHMKDNSLPVPDIWSSECSSCALQKLV